MSKVFAGSADFVSESSEVLFTSKWLVQHSVGQKVFRTINHAPAFTSTFELRDLWNHELRTSWHGTVMLEGCISSFLTAPRGRLREKHTSVRRHVLACSRDRLPACCNDLSVAPSWRTINHFCGRHLTHKAQHHWVSVHDFSVEFPLRPMSWKCGALQLSSSLDVQGRHPLNM